jgi:hypothetical protein
MGEVRDALLRGEKKIVLLEGFQASPARPSDKDSMKVKTLEWLKIVT